MDNTIDTGAVYALCHPRSGEPHYVGASRYPERRIQGHVTTGRGRPVKSQKKLAAWLRAVPFEAVILEDEVPMTELRKTERWWIDYFTEQGAALLNQECRRVRDIKEGRCSRCLIPYDGAHPWCPPCRAARRYEREGHPEVAKLVFLLPEKMAA